MPSVSIILPIYNSEKYIEKTLKSIINQTYTDWELIIIDDCSTDRSMELVEKYKNDKFIIIRNDINQGPGISRNLGIDKSKGKYIAFIDSDDIWKEKKLEYQIKFMKENNIAFSFSGYDRIKNEMVIRKVEVPKIIKYDDLLKNTIILTSTVILDIEKINREVIKFENLRMSEDLVLFLNILKIGYLANGFNMNLVQYRVGKKGELGKKLYSLINVWKVYKNHEKLEIIPRLNNYLSYIKNAFKKRIPYGIFYRIVEIMNLITVKEILDFFVFPFFITICLIARMFLKSKKIWIIEENYNEACDNGYVFFKYIRNTRKDINAFYVIDKKSKQYEKVKDLGNIIQNYSLKHWMYYISAEKIIITQKYANPSPAIFYLLHKNNIIKTPRIFLQHGIMLSDCRDFYYDRTNFRLFICGAKKEYEYIKKIFNYPNENVVYTGLARYDNLKLDIKQENNSIIIYPTWRKWIRSKKDYDLFIKNYLKIIYNQEFIRFIEDNNITVQLVLHKKLKKYKTNTLSKSSNIVINNNEDVDIQDLINKASLMITDYSSISCDMAYRMKPVIYYQFDKAEFSTNHLQEGLFIYETEGFGDIEYFEDKLIEKVKYYANNNYKAEKKYYDRMIEFFERKDNSNCARILDEIEKI